MLRRCKYCGKTYDGACGSSACPECVDIRRHNIIRQRVCRECGATFPGGPRAWYCPNCRRERERNQDRERQHNGPKRHLGDTDRCLVCGGEYIVTNGCQKYCPACAPEAIREAQRVQSRKYVAENVTLEGLTKIRKAAVVPIPCAVCGKLFPPSRKSKTCSPECSAVLKKRITAEWNLANSERMKEYFHERYLRKKQAKNTSPEEPETDT